MALRQRHGVGLLAFSRSGQRIVQRLSSVRLRAGDVVLLRGSSGPLPDTLGELRVPPQAERAITLGHSRRSRLPAATLALAMALVALVALRVMTMHEAYETVEWPVLILLGALIPISEAIQRLGGTDLLAGWLTAAVQNLPRVGALAVTLMVAMLGTPFLNNAATVLVVGPIAATLASKLDLNPDPFLMAVALGAACDFLTPSGTSATPW